MQITGLPILALSMLASNAGAQHSLARALTQGRQGIATTIYFSGIPEQAKWGENKFGLVCHLDI